MGGEAPTVLREARQRSEMFVLCVPMSINGDFLRNFEILVRKNAAKYVSISYFVMK